MIRYTIRYKGAFFGFSTDASAPEAITKYARLNNVSASGLTAARPVR